MDVAPLLIRDSRSFGRRTNLENGSGEEYTPGVAVNPDARDSTTQQIQLKLGNYSLVKHLLDEPKRLIGIEGVPPSPAPPPAVCLRLSSNSVGSNSRSSPSSQEFKKPGGPRIDGSGSSSSALSSSSSSASSSASSTSSSSSHQQQQQQTQQQQQQPRGGFVKPADGKPPYGGRGSYPGQPLKLHGASGNDHRSHGLLPPKGPPTNSPGNGTLVNNSNIGNSNGSRLHSVGSSRLSRLPLDNGTSSRPGPAENSADVENILKRADRRTPRGASRFSANGGEGVKGSPGEQSLEAPL
ncbi:hypothetical protein K0M31_017408 [Melipona bicolor]|uniref:Uncharacterized protein n=1 Tax=Melipona bicolor TaxID=60889 RepID=A0AA40KSH7_9HYME|nr:hypothetical protein K0M31_017408 [Melipona bicolor]